MKKNETNYIKNVLYDYYNHYLGVEKGLTKIDLLNKCYGDEFVENISLFEADGREKFNKIWMKIYRILKNYIDGEAIKICSETVLDKGMVYYSLRTAREGKRYADKLKNMSEGFNLSSERTLRVAKLHDPVGFEEVIKEESQEIIREGANA